ncbi:MAG: metallophosphoesterase [Ruminococcus sp.]|nr:metallophosphoesterase [Ruminococcus sp.]
MQQDQKHYRFAVLADIHIDLENGGENNYFIHAQKNFTNALKIIKKSGCAFIVSAGDQVTNAAGAEEEWQKYREIIDRSGYQGQIFEAMGNHETRFAKYGGCTVDECRKEFIRYARLDKKPILRPSDKTYYVYLDDTFDDAFLFLSLENGVDTPLIDNFSDEQMDWAEEMAERFTREGRRIFLIQHAPIYGFGAGDDNHEPAYRGSIRLNNDDEKNFRNNRRFFDLICRYKDMIWLSGHTHVDLRDNVNYQKADSHACHMLHIPALSGSTRLSRDDTGKRILDRTFYDDAAQGYIADVYEDRVVFNGIDFLHDRIYPEYVYTIYQLASPVQALKTLPFSFG